MRFTKWGEYGILFCVHLGREQAQLGAAELASVHQIPTQYAQQILHRLRKGGIIASTRGPRGGFHLAKSPDELTMKDILTAAEGTTFELICNENPLFDSCGAEAHCSVRYVWQELKAKVDEALENMTLSAIISKSGSISNNLIPLPSRTQKVAS